MMSVPCREGRRRRIASVSAFLIAVGAVGLAPPAAAQTQARTAAPEAVENERFGNWVLRCQTLAEGARRCELTQDAVIQQTGQRLLRIAVGPASAETERLVGTTEGSDLVGALITPLGVILPDGVTVAVPEQGAAEAAEPWRFDAYQCIPDGCRFLFPVPADLRAALTAAPSATVSFSLGGRPIEIPLPLEGFAAGVTALEDRSG